MDEKDILLAKNGDEEAMEKGGLKYKSDILIGKKLLEVLG